MKVAFRVDSSNLIGAGHLRRCLKLADDLKYKCKEIIFITKNLNGNFNNLVKKKKFKVVLIKNIKSKNKLDYDLNFTKSICKKFKINTLILDHYYLGLSWEKNIKKDIDKLVVIDDFSKKKHFCDLIINNLNNKEFNKTKHLTGFKYVIIPNNYVKKKNKQKNSKMLTIGTFFGSTDKTNCSERLLKIFSQKEFLNFKFISILGKNNKNKERIEKSFRKYKNLYVEKKFIKMKNLFKKIDILITVGGVTSFEALCCNIECIYIPINHYQKASCNFIKKTKTSYILSYNKVFNKNGKQLLINCFKKILKKRAMPGKKIHIDVHGSKRIADYILGTEFKKNIGVSKTI